MYNNIPRIVSNVIKAINLAVNSSAPLNVSTEEAILREKRLARKDLIESEAFKRAMPSTQIQMLKSLETDQ